MSRRYGAWLVRALLCSSLQGCIEAVAIEGDIQHWLEVGVSIPDTLVAEVEYEATVTVEVAIVEVSPEGPEDWYQYQDQYAPDSALVTVGFEAGTVIPASGTTDASGRFKTVVRAEPLEGASEIRVDFTFSATVPGMDFSDALPGSRGGELFGYPVVVVAPDSVG